jgi:hypothetical protein
MKVEFNLIECEKLSVILPLLAELDSSIPFDECIGIYSNENLIIIVPTRRA